MKHPDTLAQEVLDLLEHNGVCLNSLVFQSDKGIFSYETITQCAMSTPVPIAKLRTGTQQ